MSSVKKLESVDNKTKCKIFGFAHNMESELSITIPIMIQYIIMTYYWINEKFTEHGGFLELNSNGTIAKTVSFASKPRLGRYGLNTVYGNNVIDFEDTSV